MIPTIPITETRGGEFWSRDGRKSAEPGRRKNGRKERGWRRPSENRKKRISVNVPVK
jgi:hypothetical protein